MVSYKALNTHPESIISNACHAVGNGNRCQASAAIESEASNARHTAGDIY